MRALFGIAAAVLAGLLVVVAAPGARADGLGDDECFDGDVFDLEETGSFGNEVIEAGVVVDASAEANALTLSTNVAGPFAGEDLDEPGMDEDGFFVDYGCFAAAFLQKGIITGLLRGDDPEDVYLRLRYDVDIDYQATDHVDPARGPELTRGQIVVGAQFQNIGDPDRGNDPYFVVLPNADGSEPPTEGQFNLSGTIMVGPLGENWLRNDLVELKFRLDVLGMARADTLSFRVNELTLEDPFSFGTGEPILASQAILLPPPEPSGSMPSREDVEADIYPAVWDAVGNEATLRSDPQGPYSASDLSSVISRGMDGGVSAVVGGLFEGCSTEDVLEGGVVVLRYDLDVNYIAEDFTPLAARGDPPVIRGFIDSITVGVSFGFGPTLAIPSLYEFDIPAPPEGAFNVSGEFSVELTEDWLAGTTYGADIGVALKDMGPADSIEFTINELTLVVPPRGAEDAAYVAASWEQNSVFFLDEDLEPIGSFPVDGNFSSNGIAVDGELIYVANWFEDEVIAYNAQGVEQLRWASVFLDGVQAMEYIPLPEGGPEVLGMDGDPIEGYLVVFDPVMGDINALNPADGSFLKSFPAESPFTIEGLAYDPVNDLLFQLDDDVIHAVSPLGGGASRGAPTKLFEIPNPAIGDDFGGTGLTYLGDDRLAVGTSEGNWYIVSSDPDCYDPPGQSCTLDSGNNGIDMFGLKFFGAPVAPACPGDFNGDGATNVFDFAILADNFGAGPGATYEQGDINGNGFIDVFDFADFTNDFGCVDDPL
jgi:hypothetical protein